MKTYYTERNIGKAKYVVNFNDGVKTHEDGSKFFDINIFKNLKTLAKFITELENSGYAKI